MTNGRDLAFYACAALLTLASVFAATVTMDVGAGPPRLIVPVHSPPDAALEVVSYRVMQEVTFIKVVGHIRNPTRAPLDTVVARARFFDGTGAPIATAETIVSPAVMLPNQIAEFSLAVPARPSMTTIQLTFGRAGKEALPTKFLEHAATTLIE